MKAQGWTTVTPGALEPLSLDEAREHLRIEHDDDLLLLEQYVKSARDWAEQYTGRALVTQTVQAFFLGFPVNGVLMLPRPRLQSVSWVKYTLGTGVQQTLDASTYRVVNGCEPGELLLAPSKSWPSDVLDVGLPVTVQYVAGYGDPEQVPASIKQGMLWVLGHMYENRESVTVSGSVPQRVPQTAQWALDPYRFRYR